VRDADHLGPYTFDHGGRGPTDRQRHGVERHREERPTPREDQVAGGGIAAERPLLDEDLSAASIDPLDRYPSLVVAAAGADREEERLPAGQDLGPPVRQLPGLGARRGPQHRPPDRLAERDRGSGRVGHSPEVEVPDPEEDGGGDDGAVGDVERRPLVAADEEEVRNPSRSLNSCLSCSRTVLLKRSTISRAVRYLAGHG
jgi:hypothetical protein